MFVCMCVSVYTEAINTEYPVIELSREIVIFTIMNTITVMDLLNISIRNTKIKHGFLKYYELSQFQVAFYTNFCW